LPAFTAKSVSEGILKIGQQLAKVQPKIQWHFFIKTRCRSAAAATDPVEIGDGDLVPVTITQLNAGWWKCSNTGDVGAE